MTSQGVSYQIGGVAAIAQRDVLKLIRDRARLAVNLAFPVLLAGGLGSLLQPTVGRLTGLDTVTLAFTGVLAATVFQSAAAGMISIVEDRETDFARELFVTPVARLTLVSGKLAGECLVALVQGACVLAFAVVFGVPATPGRLAGLALACLGSCLLGGSFGLATVAALPNQRSAMQVFQFLIIPQYVLAGVLVPLRGVAPWLRMVSALMPLRYAVDAARAAYYTGTAGYAKVVAGGLALDTVVAGTLFAVFLTVGTALFIRRERAR